MHASFALPQSTTGPREHSYWAGNINTKLNISQVGHGQCKSWPKLVVWVCRDLTQIGTKTIFACDCKLERIRKKKSPLFFEASSVIPLGAAITNRSGCRASEHPSERAGYPITLGYRRLALGEVLTRSAMISFLDKAHEKRQNLES